MPVDVDAINLIAARTVDAYKEAELQLVAALRDAIRKEAEGEAAGLADLTRERLTAVQLLRRAAEGVVARLSDHADVAFREAVAAGYRNGRGGATLNLPGPLGVDARAARAHVPQFQVIDSLASALIRDVGNKHLNILRQVDDIYRQVTTAAAVRSVAGGITRLEASQAAWQGLVDQGVTGFTDVRGRRWQLTSYVEMAVRTVTMRAAVQGQVDRLVDQGVDLVEVSDEVGECVRCRPWEGKILRIGPGEIGRVKVESLTTGRQITITVAGTLETARLAGLLHPNCEHTIRGYLPGATKLPKGDLADPEHDKAKQKQRAIERQIRRHKMRQEAALTPEAKAEAAARVRGWQATMRQHLKDNPRLKRLPYREQIGAGNLPPAGGAPSPAGRLTGPPPPPTMPGTVEQRAGRRAAARERQRQIAAADTVAQLAAEIDPVMCRTTVMAFDDPDQLAGILADRLATSGVNEADLRELTAAVHAQRFDAVAVAARDLAARHGLTPIGRAGETAAYDPDVHRLVEDLDVAPGALVEVIRQGHNLTIGGDLVHLDRPAVVPAAAQGPFLPSRNAPPLEVLFDALVANPSRDRVLDVAPFVDGQYGDLTVTTRSATVDRLLGDTQVFLIITGQIHDAAGNEVGEFTRLFARDATDGRLIAYHASLTLDDDVQGSGFAEAFNGNLLNWYRRSDVKHVELVANIDIGGYAWAAKGFDWANERGARKLFDKLRTHLLIVDGMDDEDRRDYFQDRPDVEIEATLLAARQLLARVDTATFDSEDWPSAYELSQLGRWPGAGKVDIWLGKRIMLGSTWDGVLEL